MMVMARVVMLAMVIVENGALTMLMAMMMIPIKILRNGF